MSKEISVREWQVKFNNGDFDSNDFRTQCDAGWYDWFCKDSSLGNKTKKMGNIVKKVKDGGKIDLDNMYVWFKNNCPMAYSLYDDFRFADIVSGNVMFTITVDSGYEQEHYDCKYAVYGRKNGFETPLACFNDSRSLVAWLNTPWED